MTLSIYMDVHVPSAITQGLRARGVQVLTAQEDGARTVSDSQLLDRATSLGYILFTQDDDFLVEAARRQQVGEPFAGVIFAPQLQSPVGRLIVDLELLAQVYDRADMFNRVEYLPF